MARKRTALRPSLCQMTASGNLTTVNDIQPFSESGLLWLSWFYDSGGK